MKLNAIRFFLFIFGSFLLFGHFNYAAQSNIDYAQNILIEQNKPILRVLFIPEKEPDAKKVLLGLINYEQESIFLAQFLLNDREIAQALCDAFDRGITILMILDEGSLKYRNEKVTMLKDKGIDILFYKKRYSIMHNKFYIFGKNLNDKPLVFTGSANATYSGFKKNQENVIIFDDTLSIEQFKKKFETLSQEILSNQKRMNKSTKVNFQISYLSMISKNYYDYFFDHLINMIN